MKVRALCFALVACGGKIDGNVEGGTPTDSGFVHPTPNPDAGLVQDATVTVDAGMPGCGPAAVSIGMGGGCKVHASWQCGADSYDVGGGCDPMVGFFGSCSKNATSTKMITDSSCPCMDPNVVKILAKLCGFPSPP